MEIFVKQQMIAPIRIVLKLFDAAKHRATTDLVAQKDPRHAIGDFLCDLKKVHQFA
jgi:hypothetical protein